jgi:hypothetical protein
MFDGVHYYSSYLDTFENQAIKVSVLLLKQMSDETFNEFYANAKHYYEIELAAATKREAELKAENQTLGS